MVDVPVMGGTIAQMMDLANHLGVGRARRVIHSNWTRGQGTFADLVDRTDVFTQFTLHGAQAPSAAMHIYFSPSRQAAPLLRLWPSSFN
jgi:hypothetical protein